MKALLQIALACLAVLLASALLFFMLYGALSMYAAPPDLRPTSPGDFAGWIQAIGSILAIVGSYVIGASQAERAHVSALKVYERQRDDRDAAEKARADQAKADSLVTIASTVAIVRRLHLETLDLTHRVDSAATRFDRAVREYKEARSALENKRINPGASWFATTEEDRVESAGNEEKTARAALVWFLSPIDDLLARLAQLPRHDIAIARPQLATVIVQAIHALNQAAIVIEHAPTRAQATAWMRTAEQALDNFGRSLLQESPDGQESRVLNEIASLN